MPHRTDSTQRNYELLYVCYGTIPKRERNTFLKTLCEKSTEPFQLNTNIKKFTTPNSCDTIVTKRNIRWQISDDMPNQRWRESMRQARASLIMTCLLKAAFLRKRLVTNSCKRNITHNRALLNRGIEHLVPWWRKELATPISFQSLLHRRPFSCLLDHSVFSKSMILFRKRDVNCANVTKSKYMWPEVRFYGGWHAAQKNISRKVRLVGSAYDWI